MAAACALVLSAVTTAYHAAPAHRALPRLAAQMRTSPPFLSSAAADGSLVDTRALDREFFTIAAPAFIQFAAEPLARLVDAAYLGRLGATALGGAGAAIAAQYAVTKLCNDPLLRSTISLVALGDGSSREPSDAGDETTSGDDRSASEVAAAIAQTDAVAAALLLALVVGVVQSVLYGIGTGPMLTGMRVGPASPMRPEASAYLRVCALGAPAATLWLVLNGIFRGLGDTRTPLLWALAFTSLNALLDPLFIFVCGFGAAGAAAGTALAQTAACVPLLLALQRKLGLPSVAALLWPSGGLATLRASLRRYVAAGSLIFVRTLGKISAYTVVGREAASLGAVSSAAHILCFQLGVVTTQVCESVAIATQTLLAREAGAADAAANAAAAAAVDADADALADAVAAAAAPRRAAARHILRRSITIGAAVSALLSLVTYLNRRSVVAGLTTDPSVQAAMVAVLPMVLVCQVLKGLAYPINGALMGGLDWAASAASMWASQLSCLACVALWGRGGARALSLPNLWATFVVLFVMQCLTGVVRIASGTGPWRVLYAEKSARGDGAA